MNVKHILKSILNLNKIQDHNITYLSFTFIGPDINFTYDLGNHPSCKEIGDNIYDAF